MRDVGNELTKENFERLTTAIKGQIETLNLLGFSAKKEWQFILTSDPYSPQFFRAAEILLATAAKLEKMFRESEFEDENNE